MFVVGCVGSGLCDGLVTCSEQSCRVRVCVSNCVLSTCMWSRSLKIWRPRHDLACCTTKKKRVTLWREKVGEAKVMSPVWSVKHRAMKALGVHPHFLISALDVGGWSVSFPGRFNPGKSRRYQPNRRMDGPRIGVDAVEKKIFFPPAIESRFLGRPFCSLVIIAAVISPAPIDEFETNFGDKFSVYLKRVCCPRCNTKRWKLHFAKLLRRKGV